MFDEQLRAPAEPRGAAQRSARARRRSPCASGRETVGARVPARRREPRSARTSARLPPGPCAHVRWFVSRPSLSESNARGPAKRTRSKPLRRRGAGRERGGGRRRRSASAPSMRTSSATTSRSPSCATVGARGVGGGVLDDREVAVAERGDLGQVGDAEHLPALRQRAQAGADRARGVPADARVDLVEHERAVGERRSVATLMIASITRESSPPEAISRSGPAGTPGLGAIMNSTASPPAGPGSRLDEDHLEGGVPHRQRGQLLAHRAARGAGRRTRARRAGRSRAPRAPARASRAAPRLRARPPRRPASSSRRARARAACSRTAWMLPPCLRSRRSITARRSSISSSALSPLASSSALRLLAVAAQLSGEILGLDQQRRAGARRGRPGAGRRRRAASSREAAPAISCDGTRELRGLRARAPRRRRRRRRASASRRRRRSRAASSSSCSCSLGAAASISASS